jgi:hypothetical protein
MYNNIDKFIRPKYGALFLVCVACILLIIFVNSRKIIEGAKSKKGKGKKSNKPKGAKKKKKSNPDPEKSTQALLKNSGVTDKNVVASNELMTTQNADQPATVTAASISKIIDNIDKRIERKVNQIAPNVIKKITPSMMKASLVTPLAEIQKNQQDLNNQIKNITSSENDFNNRVKFVISDLDQKAKTNMDNLTNYYKDISLNLYNQQNMYKTGMSNEAKTALDSIKNLNADSSSLSNQAILARDGAVESKNRVEKIYNDVFGKTTATVVQQDIQKESFTQRGFFSSKEGDNFERSVSIDANLFKLEGDLIHAINDFNATYYKFITCSSLGTEKCSSNSKDAYENDVNNNKAKAIHDAIVALQSKYTASITDAKFKENHQIIMDKSKSIDELRIGLDEKMATILKIKNPPNEMTLQYDSTVYTGIMWSVLATSIVFYIFTEM